MTGDVLQLITMPKQLLKASDMLCRHTGCPKTPENAISSIRFSIIFLYEMASEGVPFSETFCVVGVRSSYLVWK